MNGASELLFSIAIFVFPIYSRELYEQNVDALRQSSRITAHYLGWDQQFDSKQSPAKSSRPGIPSVSDPGCPRIF